MNDDKTGGPAFPMSGDPNVDFDRGMTLWDWYAGHALAGMLNDSRTMSVIHDVAKSRDISVTDVIARATGDAADAMIVERKKRGIV